MKDKSKNNKITDLLSKNKYVLIVVLAGVFLLLLPLGGGSGGEAPLPETRQTNAVVSEFSLYEQERRIAYALSQIDGAGEVTVVLTLRSSGQRVLAQDIRSTGRSSGGDAENTELTESTVIISAGSQQQSPVALKYIYPEYLGALIVAEGADNATVRLELMNAVASLTGLGTDRITVTRMRSQ
ncbi:MAG: stage III sporulation protein AG [Oscillospiraceae bacterium]|nr:stage III sporulation protein AG [Oscillospiraceae bacterium]